MEDGSLKLVRKLLTTELQKEQMNAEEIHRLNVDVREKQYVIKENCSSSQGGRTGALLNKRLLS